MILTSVRDKYKKIVNNPKADDVYAFEMQQVVRAYDKGRADEHELNLALAELVLHSDFGYCFTCENNMKNITIDGINNGCDGGCCHNKEWSTEEFLEMFTERFEFEKRYKAKQLKEKK